MVVKTVVEVNPKTVLLASRNWSNKKKIHHWSRSLLHRDHARERSRRQRKKLYSWWAYDHKFSICTIKNYYYVGGQQLDSLYKDMRSFVGSERRDLLIKWLDILKLLKRIALSRCRCRCRCHHMCVKSPNLKKQNDKNFTSTMNLKKCHKFKVKNWRFSDDILCFLHVTRSKQNINFVPLEAPSESLASLN